MANEIYHRSNWGNAVNDIAWGDTYEKFDATNEMFVRSDNYENSNETDKLMAAINPKPSILLTPTAYDNGSLHSVKPVQSFGSEIVVNGNYETDSDWSKGAGCTIENGKANLLNAAAFGFALSQTPSFTVGRKYLVEYSILQHTTGSIRVRLGSNLGTTRNGNGTFTETIVAQANSIIFQPTSTFTGSIDNVSAKEIIDADFDFTRGSSATRVNEQGLIEDVTDTDLPRIDYTDGTGSLLLEPQSTNLLTYSEDFSQWTTSNFTANSETTIAPNGNTVNGYDFGDGYIFKDTAALDGSSSYTNSIYIKANKSATIGLRKGGAGSATDDVDINLTTNWQRFEATSVVLNSSLNGRLLLDNRTIKGYGVSDLKVFIFAAQQEKLSFATSYIPTSGSTVTRLADVCNNSGSSDLINSTEGVLYAEIAALADDLTSRVISLSDGTANERVVLQYHNTTNRIRCFIKSGGSFYATLDKVVSDITDFHKIAYKYKSGETKLFVDGSLITSSSNTFSITGLNVLQFANGTPTASPLQGKVKSVAVFKEALSDTELEKLTTI